MACLGWRADRLRHGQGHRARRRHRARGAARQDRREGGLPPLMKPLVDGHGRSIGDVRISVTDRCNFRCQYCMPAEGLPWLDRSHLLTYEEIERLVRAAGVDGRARRAAHRRRAAGAEGAVAAGRAPVGDRGRAGPLAHHERLPAHPPGRPARRAGLRRINVSLDSLAPRPLLPAHPPRLARAGARGPGGRAAARGAAADQGQRRRAQGLHRGRGAALRRVRSLEPVRGALHRVHAARRRPHVDARQGAAERRHRGA